MLPFFALTAAGVPLKAAGEMLSNSVAIGVFLGLVLGKTIGIAGGAWLTTRLSPAELSPSLRWPDIIGMAQLAGIGFTVSLFVAELAYPADPTTLDVANAAVLAASVMAALLGSIALGVRSASIRRNVRR